MLQPQMLGAQVAKNVQSAVDAASEGAKKQCAAVLEAAAELRRHQSSLALAVGDRSKVAVERAMRDNNATIDFARRALDLETAAAKSFASVTSPTEFLAAQDAYVRTSLKFYSSELAASANRFMEALGDWNSWPTLTKASAAT